jgi:hypothetical protein
MNFSDIFSQAYIGDYEGLKSQLVRDPSLVHSKDKESADQLIHYAAYGGYVRIMELLFYETTHLQDPRADCLKVKLVLPGIVFIWHGGLRDINRNGR